MFNRRGSRRFFSGSAHRMGDLEMVQLVEIVQVRGAG